MALETVTYINDLVVTNPTSSDAKSQGDDHLRNIKAALKECLNGFTGAIILTATDTGSATAHVLTPSTALVGYTTGLLLLYRPVTTNSSGAVTVNVSGLGAKSIKTDAGADPTANDIVANQPLLLMYDGTNFVLIGGSEKVNKTGNQTITGTITLAGGLTQTGDHAITGNLTTSGTIVATGTVTGATPTLSTHLVTKAYADALAFAAALPAQAGNAGKFVTTNGTTASWANSGISTVNATVTASATITGNYKYVPVAMTAIGQSVTLPDATTLAVGGPQYVIENKGGYSFGIRDNAGGLIAVVGVGGEALVSLKDISSAAGIWSVAGNALEPGFVTIDNTFSSTYTSTLLTQYVGLDNNTSIHFLSLSSGFAAFVCDNAGKVVTTPVTVSSTASHVPRIAFKISSTQAIVFYGTGTTYAAVVLTISGSSPSLSLAVGTPASSTITSDSNWGKENFQNEPRIAQLTTTLYLCGYTNSSTTQVLAVSVSGSTVTIGSPATIIGSAACTDAVTTYALTATTGLVIYKSGAATPRANNAVVISVSGTTCTVNTPVAATNCQSSSTTGASSVLLSSTKALIADDNNTTQATVCAFTISGTTVTAGTALAVETGLSASGSCIFTAASADRYGSHLTAVSGTTAYLWYYDTSTGISRAVFLTESAGTITAGTILFNSLAEATSGNPGFGYVAYCSAGDIYALQQDGTSNAWNLKCVPHKVSGTTITAGAQSERLFGATTVNGLNSGSQGISGKVLSDYVTMPGSRGPGLSIVRSNGDQAKLRGVIPLPSGAYLAATPLPAVNNRLVLLQTPYATTIAKTPTLPVRLLNVELTQ